MRIVHGQREEDRLAALQQCMKCCREVTMADLVEEAEVR